MTPQNTESNPREVKRTNTVHNTQKIGKLGEFERRHESLAIPREDAQKYLDKLKEIYQKLCFCQNYPKTVIKLLNRSCKSIETYLKTQGFPKDRLENIFKESIDNPPSPEPKPPDADADAYHPHPHKIF